MTDEEINRLEIYRTESANREDWDNQIKQSKLSTAIEQEELNLFNILNPALFRYGDQWCVLHGENIQDGICGFGSSPTNAIYAFNKAWVEDLPQGHPNEVIPGTTEALDKLSIKG